MMHQSPGPAVTAILLSTFSTFSSYDNRNSSNSKANSRGRRSSGRKGSSVNFNSRAKYNSGSWQFPAAVKT